jgi:hypothetical protein
MLVSIAKLLGMSGLVVAVFYLLYKQILALEIFSKLSRNQTFSLIFVMAILTWLLAVFWLFGDKGVNIINGNGNVISSGSNRTIEGS